MIFVFRVEQGALIEVPIHERDQNHGKNWLATIASDPREPGGLHREFIPKAGGRFYYFIDDLPELAPIEFGADRVRSRGRKGNQKDVRRWFGVVLAVAENHVTVCGCLNEVEAIETADRLLTDAEERRQLIRDAIDSNPELTQWLQADLSRLDDPIVDQDAAHHRVAGAREAWQRLTDSERQRLLGEFVPSHEGHRAIRIEIEDALYTELRTQLTTRHLTGEFSGRLDALAHFILASIEAGKSDITLHLVEDGS